MFSLICMCRTKMALKSVFVYFFTSEKLTYDRELRLFESMKAHET